MGVFSSAELKKKVASGEIALQDSIRKVDQETKVAIGIWLKIKDFPSIAKLAPADVSNNPEQVKSSAAETASSDGKNLFSRVGDKVEKIAQSVKSSAAGTASSDEKNLFSRASDRVGKIAQTEQIELSSVKTLFAEVFTKHSAEDLESHFAVGLPTTTPTIADIRVELRPWVFVRALLFFAIAFFLLWIGWKEYQNPNLIPGIIFIGSFAFPISFLIFFFECNLPRNISFFTIVKLFIWGGILGLLVSLFLFENDLGLGRILGASVASIVEEPAKLVAVLILARSVKYKWTLNGLCLGAAVGAGFAAFESAGYALRFLMIGGPDVMLDVIYGRGLLSPFAHIIWTAIVAGALWRVKKGNPFKFNMLLKEKFLRPALIAVVLHFLWNCPLPGLLPFFLGYLLLGVVGWIVVFGLLFGAIKEIRNAQAELID